MTFSGKGSFINGPSDDGPARVILKVNSDGSVDNTWFYTVGHYQPGTWSGPQTF